MMVLSLFIIGHMGLFFYNKIGSIISIVDLPTTNIIEPEIQERHVSEIFCCLYLIPIYGKNEIKYEQINC